MSPHSAVLHLSWRRNPQQPWPKQQPVSWTEGSHTTDASLASHQLGAASLLRRPGIVRHAPVTVALRNDVASTLFGRKVIRITLSLIFVYRVFRGGRHVTSNIRPPTPQLRGHHCERAASASFIRLIASPSLPDTSSTSIHILLPKLCLASRISYPLSLLSWVFVVFLPPSSLHRSHRRTSAAAAATAAPSMQHNADGPHPRCWAAERRARIEALQSSRVFQLHNSAKIKPAATEGVLW